MSNLVTKRFIKCHNELLENQHIKSSSMMAQALGVHRQSLNRIITGDSDVTVQLLEKFVELFHVNPSYLLTGEGEKFVDQSQVFEAAKIAFVPRLAYAGYSEQFQDPAFLNQLTYFSLPDQKFREGAFRCFEIAGDSMKPTFNAGDKVVCSHVFDIYFEQLLKDGKVYVIVTETDIFLKRILNKIKSHKAIVLLSDNEDYKPTELPIHEVKEIWKVELRLSDDFNSKVGVNMEKTIS